MSFKKIMVCNVCKEFIQKAMISFFGFEDDYVVGLTHMCEKCQRKELGHFKGDKNEF